MAALSRDELIGILTEIVHATRARLSEARTADRLKAAEMLAKMCGWNELEQVKHNHVHLQVDAALIEQLRVGHAEWGRRQQQQIAARCSWQTLNSSVMALVRRSPPTS
jgi:hypothetical protein